MKSKAILTISFLLINIITFFYSCSEFKKNNSDAVKLELSVEHSEYIKHEKIWINVELINNSKEYYSLKEYFDVTILQLDVIGPDYSKWKNGYNGLAPRYMEGDPDKLAPGEIKEISYPLNNIYYDDNRKYPTGTYTVTALYQGIKSNEVTFNLKNQSDDDKYFYNILYYYQNIDSIERMIDKYPQSKYIPQAYSELISIFSMEYLNSRTDRINKCENAVSKYLAKYNDKAETYYLIMNYDKYLQIAMQLSKSQRKEKLKILAGTYPKTKAEIIINKFIEENLDN